MGSCRYQLGDEFCTLADRTEQRLPTGDVVMSYSQNVVHVGAQRQR